MHSDLWISVLLAIPLAIVANLITPWARQWLDTRAEAGARRRSQRTLAQRRHRLEQLEHAFSEMVVYRSDSARLHAFLLEVLIRATLYGALGGIYASLIWAFQPVLDRNLGSITVSVSVAAQLITVITSLMVFQIAWRGLRVMQRIRNFDRFAQATKAEMNQIRSELGKPTEAVD